ncbi:hypothetical protein JOE48_003566 [Methylobacterium sp. PvR107]|nr:hypothetical protein [Methylobacterium sp. PvR107]
MTFLREEQQEWTEPTRAYRSRERPRDCRGDYAETHIVAALLLKLNHTRHPGGT